MPSRVSTSAGAGRPVWARALAIHDSTRCESPRWHAPQTHQHLNRAGRAGRRHQEVDEGSCIVGFMDCELGYIDLEQTPCNRSTTRSERGCYLCLRYGL